MNEEEQKAFGSRHALVTADSPQDRRDYNCHGFSMGIRDVLTTSDGPEFMKGKAYKGPYQEPPDTDEEVVALFYKPNTLECWHTAKRLRGPSLPPDLYESKLGKWDGGPHPLAGKRIVHRLHAVRQHYGKVHSFWVRDSSKPHRSSNPQLISDSAKLLSKRPDLVALLPPISESEIPANRFYREEEVVMFYRPGDPKSCPGKVISLGPFSQPARIRCLKSSSELVAGEFTLK